MVHTHACVQARSRDPRVDMDSLPTVDDVSDPERWELGLMRALFPVDFDWSPYLMCQAARIRRHFQICPLIHIVKPVGQATVAKPVANAKRARQSLENDLRQWLQQNEKWKPGREQLSHRRCVITLLFV